MSITYFGAEGWGMGSTEKMIISKATNRPAALATRGKILGPKPSEKLVGRDLCGV
jgi:hypothetical protein